MAATRTHRIALAPLLGAGGLALLVLGPGCRRAPLDRPEVDAASAFEERREERMSLIEQLSAQGIRDRRVLEAMERVPRHAFVPLEMAAAAYLNQPLPIGAGQTISQPYIVAAMSEALELEPGMSVLEIGTGSGYQAAILAELTDEVFTIEIIPELAEGAREVLARLGYQGVRLRVGDGWLGWPEEAPFDRILLTAAPQVLPPALLEQLAAGGRLVAPIGSEGAVQDLRLVTKDADGTLAERSLGAVRFVPMTGGGR